MSRGEEVQYIYKILLLGDSSVGKTCLLKRYVDGTFQEVYMSTIGLDYRLKFITLPESQTKIKIQIWDTAGQDRFRALTKNYYKGAHGIILVYDITEEKTFENVRAWMEQIEESSSENVTVFLVGNKIDKEESRKIPTENGESIAKEYNISFSEASAKTNQNVDEIFYNLVKEIHSKNLKNINETGGKELSAANKKKFGGCCK